jgi:hypothetical protein
MSLEDLIKRAENLEKEKSALIKELLAQREIIDQKLSALGHTHKTETRGRKPKDKE